MSFFVITKLNFQKNKIEKNRNNEKQKNANEKTFQLIPILKMLNVHNTEYVLDNFYGDKMVSSLKNSMN